MQDIFSTHQKRVLTKQTRQEEQRECRKMNNMHEFAGKRRIKEP